MLFDAEVQHVAQHGPRVVVRVRHGAGHETLDGDYLIAADGSRSDVRAALGIDFDGEDYPDKILRVMTTDDLDALLPGIAPVTYLWNGMKSVSFLRMPDCWRIILRVPKEVDDAQALDPYWILARLREVMPHIDRLPTVVMKDVYGVSKRVASRYRDGRILLAGDSAHVTNTRGGMNMNCGMHDAYALARAIIEAERRGHAARRRRLRRAPARRHADAHPAHRPQRRGRRRVARSRPRDGERPRQDRVAPSHHGDARHGRSPVMEEEDDVRPAAWAGVLVPPSNPSIEPELARCARRQVALYASRFAVMPDTTLEQRNRRYLDLYRDAVKSFGELALAGDRDRPDRPLVPAAAERRPGARARAHGTRRRAGDHRQRRHRRCAHGAARAANLRRVAVSRNGSPTSRSHTGAAPSAKSRRS